MAALGKDLEVKSGVILVRDHHRKIKWEQRSKVGDQHETVCACKDARK